MKLAATDIFAWEAGRRELVQRLQALVDSEEDIEAICGNNWTSIKQSLGIETLFDH